jgi:hypothetical protein
LHIRTSYWRVTPYRCQHGKYMEYFVKYVSYVVIGSCTLRDIILYIVHLWMEVHKFLHSPCCTCDRDLKFYTIMDLCIKSVY